MHNASRPSNRTTQGQAAKSRLVALPKPPAERATPLRPGDPKSFNFWAGVRFLEQQGWSFIGVEGETAAWCVFRRRS